MASILATILFCFLFKYNSSDTGLVPKIVRLYPTAVGRRFTFTKKSCTNYGKCCMKVELYGHRSGEIILVLLPHIPQCALFLNSVFVKVRVHWLVNLYSR